MGVIEYIIPIFVSFLVKIKRRFNLLKRHFKKIKRRLVKLNWRLDKMFRYKRKLYKLLAFFTLILGKFYAKNSYFY
jgi:hypothetical protein